MRQTVLLRRLTIKLLKVFLSPSRHGNFMVVNMFFHVALLASKVAMEYRKCRKKFPKQ